MQGEVAILSHQMRQRAVNRRDKQRADDKAHKVGGEGIRHAARAGVPAQQARIGKRFDHEMPASMANAQKKA